MLFHTPATPKTVLFFWLMGFKLSFHPSQNQVKSKPGRCVAGPFWAQAVNQKRQYLQIRIYKSLHFWQCRSCRKSQKCQPCFFVLCVFHIPSKWGRTLFTTLAKHREAAPDFRPTASVQLFDKVFVYMILHRIEPYLDSHQPEEQHGFFFPRAFLTAEHGFRAGRRLEEHLLTANLFVDKTLAANSPVWRLSLDLSKNF